ncbi:hypothetical protein M758_8G186600 [Ceratodon purpureus]|nr:hypothetical protein M758_8G186600 [Ceratodon purpureus]
MCNVDPRSFEGTSMQALHNEHTLAVATLLRHMYLEAEWQAWYCSGPLATARPLHAAIKVRNFNYFASFSILLLCLWHTSTMNLQHYYVEKSQRLQLPCLKLSEFPYHYRIEIFSCLS